MEEYTREQIQRADDTDLYVFLSGRGEQFKRCGKEYRWLRHDSVMITRTNGIVLVRIKVVMPSIL